MLVIFVSEKKIAQWLQECFQLKFLETKADLSFYGNDTMLCVILSSFEQAMSLGLGLISRYTCSKVSGLIYLVKDVTTSHPFSLVHDVTVGHRHYYPMICFKTNYPSTSWQGDIHTEPFFNIGGKLTSSELLHVIRLQNDVTELLTSKGVKDFMNQFVFDMNTYLTLLNQPCPSQEFKERFCSVYRFSKTEEYRLKELLRKYVILGRHCELEELLEQKISKEELWLFLENSENKYV